jgi:tetratricopeptide (TPR) repeat protein
VLTVAAQARGQEQDLREYYGTRSLEAAKQISEAKRLHEAKKYRQALEAIDAAINADERAQAAYAWKGRILADLGEIPASIDAYKKCLSTKVVATRRITATAAYSIGNLLGKLQDHDQSNLYYTRAILADYDNIGGIRAASVRGIAINEEQRGHFTSAYLALTLAVADKAKDIPNEWVRRLERQTNPRETARVLTFYDKTPVIVKRTEMTRLSPVPMEGGIGEGISELWPDPQGRYVVGISRNRPYYYLITTAAKISVRKISCDSPLICACLAGEKLHAVVSGPPRLEIIAPETGHVGASWPLHSHLPNSIAVLPISRQACFQEEGWLCDLDLKTGKITKVGLAGDLVAAHPTKQFVYAYINQDSQRRTLRTILKAAAVPSGMLPAEARGQTATNGTRMSLSPDGNWIAVAGRGRWQSPDKQVESGYGVAVFSAVSLEDLQGFFPVGVSPNGVCFNPVTNQVAVIREEDAAIYHLSDSQTSVTVKGPFNGTGAWSGDGRYLLLGRGDAGVLCWSNSLSSLETRVASTWWKNLTVTDRNADAPSLVFPEVAAIRQFNLTKPTRELMAQALAKALREGSTNKPPSWMEFAAYAKDDAMRQAIQDANRSLHQEKDFGFAMFQIRKSLEKYPECAPLKFVLGEALQHGNQPDAAEKSYLDAIHSDAGRTDLSRIALNQLATLLASQDKDLSALHCLITSLGFDRGHPQTFSQTIRLLRKNKFDKEADQVAQMASGLPSLPTSTHTELPRLPKPPSDSKRLTAAELYRKAVASVVLIRAGDKSGSGVCVGAVDYILTNQHVVNGGGTIEVYPFAYENEALSRLPKVVAKVVFQSARDDIAVLKLDSSPAQLRPLAVAERSPGIGERVYAIGSPGFGRQVLEESISEGIISSAKRVIDGSDYLQHTAAVNPGNSGGPLIDEHGRLAGVVTLKAQLENVSFAIPVEKVRSIFKSQ